MWIKYPSVLLLIIKEFFILYFDIAKNVLFFIGFNDKNHLKR